MNKEQPKLIILAGANGSGKTTAAEFLLQNTDVKEFVNTDEIAKGLSPFNPEGQKIMAGRLFLSRINNLIKKRQSFAFETTLSGKLHIRLIEAAKAAGYEVVMYYLYTGDVSLNIERIKIRVQQGGHDVPEEDIRRRYKRSLCNLVNVYWDLCDTILVSYNTGDITPIISKYYKTEKIYNEWPWEGILEEIKLYEHKE